MTELVRRPARADARRNYDALVAAASEVFAEQGPDAALDEIARRAGVGNATLYRHFATRRDLIVAVCAGEVDALRALGAGPRAALVPWLRAYVEHIGAHRGLAAAFQTDDDSALVATFRAAVEQVAAGLLAAAQRTGEIRADLGVRELLALANAIASATESSSRTDADRLLSLVVEGLRHRNTGHHVGDAHRAAAGDPDVTG
jgi:AcrR family transcriptional regulator